MLTVILRVASKLLPFIWKVVKWGIMLIAMIALVVYLRSTLLGADKDGITVEYEEGLSQVIGFLFLVLMACYFLLQRDDSDSRT